MSSVLGKMLGHINLLISIFLEKEILENFHIYIIVINPYIFLKISDFSYIIL